MNHRGTPQIAGKRLRPFRNARLSGEDLRDANLAGADLTGARLDRANLNGVDLEGCIFRDADLDGADLRDTRLGGSSFASASLAGVRADGASFARCDLGLTDFREADLRYADFSEAVLMDANLTRARLGRACLRDANLIGAGLGGADLRQAILAGANLREAHLDGANFAHARFAFTVIAASDLSRTHGLDTAVHDGPSTIGIDAFLLSRGEIPEAFLAGTGLSPLTIEYLKSVAAAEEGMLVGDAVFLVFADADRRIARRLRAHLRMHGFACWYWQEREELAGEWNRDLRLRVRFQDRVLLLWSGSTDVAGEDVLRRAVEVEAEEVDRRPKVFAALAGPTDVPSPLPRERFLADFRGVDWSDPRDRVFHRELRRLLDGLGHPS